MIRSTLLFLIFFVPSYSFANSHVNLDEPYFVKIPAKNAAERTQITSAGVAIEEILSDYVFGTIPYGMVNMIKKKFPGGEFYPVASVLDFPSEDKEFHNFDEVLQFYSSLTKDFPDTVRVFEIGKSLENRPIHAILISDLPDAEDEAEPAILFLGTHHAREHLSTEIPLYLARQLAEGYGKNERITNLINHRQIWIIPLVNPDGSVYDVEGSSYRAWRKNRSHNFDGTFGVDLNRNYGYMWGKEGSSGTPRSDIYRGPAAFSEPETQVIRDFILAHNNISILLSYHTYSELILYPWGYTDSPISDQRAQRAYVEMAEKMAGMTNYTPMPGHELYLVSGEMGDWAWGEKGIFSFTFELYPSRWGNEGFYPSDKMIPVVGSLNVAPALYLIDLADDPYRAINKDAFDPLGMKPEIAPLNFANLF